MKRTWAERIVRIGFGYNLHL